MGYACPVCGDPQADGVHLANHVAFTAITGGGDHEDWLAERVPDWGELGEEELAEYVVDFAREVEYPQVFEASGGPSGGDPAVDATAAQELAGDPADEDVRAIVERARELTPTPEAGEGESDADANGGTDADGESDADADGGTDADEDAARSTGADESRSGGAE